VKWINRRKKGCREWGTSPSPSEGGEAQAAKSPTILSKEGSTKLLGPPPTPPKEGRTSLPKTEKRVEKGGRRYNKR